MKNYFKAFLLLISKFHISLPLAIIISTIIISSGYYHIRQKEILLDTINTCLSVERDGLDRFRNNLDKDDKNRAIYDYYIYLCDIGDQEMTSFRPNY